MPRERPILFSSSMVRAILAGTKTQTRRLARSVACVVDGVPYTGTHKGTVAKGDHGAVVACPYGEPGDRLWVRETWAPWADEKTRGYLQDCGTGPNGERPDPRAFLPALYRADYDESLSSLDAGGCERWRPSIHMPRWASRITLEITGVRVERVQDISEEDAREEGIAGKYWPTFLDGPGSTILYGDDGGHTTARGAFAELWDKINGKRAPWASNPWVWVLEFRRVGAKERAA